MALLMKKTNKSIEIIIDNFFVYDNTADISINQDIKRTLSEKRYIHSLGVMNKAEELAKQYHINVDKAKIVGLAHDIAKEMPKEEKIAYVKNHNIEIFNSYLMFF